MKLKDKFKKMKEITPENLRTDKDLQKALNQHWMFFEDVCNFIHSVATDNKAVSHHINEILYRLERLKASYQYYTKLAFIKRGSFKIEFFEEEYEQFLKKEV
jgi:hypothetical protein